MVRGCVVSAPTPESLGALFSEVWDLCEQYAANITDAEVEEKLAELLASTAAPSSARPFGPQLNDWLEHKFAADLPCHRKVNCKGGPRDEAWCCGENAPADHLTCGEPSVAIVTLWCPECGTKRRPYCRHHLHWMSQHVRAGLIDCATCGLHALTWGGVS